MTLREFFLERIKAEAPVFTRVLEALPSDQLSYTPHDRSPSVEQIVGTLANEFKVCVDVVRDNRGEWVATPPMSLAELLALFARSTSELADRVSKMDDAAWDRKAQFYFGGKMVSEQPVGTFLWFILFDAIHHRGQLSAYLRPMGAKVPAIYGPSGDEKGS
jgi:uncharacterized damage-inducible protein DinB